jgi:hypothetical protein
MTYPTETTLDFADGRYRFFLTLPLLTEFENKHGSILMLEPPLRQGIGLDEAGKPIFVGAESEARAPICRDLIRLALIGGNKGTVDGEDVEVGPGRAKELVDVYTFPARPLAEAAALAWQIASVIIYGNNPRASEAEAADSAESVAEEPQDG